MSLVSANKAAFVTAFYAESDRPDTIDAYLSFLTPDVDFVMGLNSSKGHAEVRKIRENMWKGVRSRKHVPLQTYVLDAEASELMLHGTVEYGLENGKSAIVGFGARMVFGAGDKLVLSKYQVWLDTSKLVAAMKSE